MMCVCTEFPGLNLSTSFAELIAKWNAELLVQKLLRIWPSCTAGENENWYNHPGEEYGVSSENQKWIYYMIQ